MTVPDPIGVVGAGTMGLGIAQLAAQAGARTLLYDPVPDALAGARERIAAALERPVASGRMSAEEAAAVVERIEPVESIAALAPCAVVIEAAPERLELKHELFAEQVGDAPGLVLGRIVCQLVNEAAFLIGEGNGTVADVDAGLELGVNHPRGPVAWSRQIGLAHVTAVLAALERERGEAYRPAPLLAQWAAHDTRNRPAPSRRSRCRPSA